MSRREAGELVANAGRYLIDETTAIVRFIIRCSTPAQYFGSDINSIIEAVNGSTTKVRDASSAEVDLIRGLFFLLFVESVVCTVEGEEEIWLVERSPTPRLFVWERLR